MLTNNILAFVSDPEYAPAKQFFHSLESSGRFNVRGLNHSNATIASTTPGTVEWLSTNITILPGRGILTIIEGQLEGRPALTTRLLQSNDRMLIGQRTLDGEVLEWQWADEDTSHAEVVRYTPEKGGERVFKLKDGRVVSLSVRGRWAGVRGASG